MTYPSPPSSTFLYSYDCRYSELERLSTFENNLKKLTYKQNKILHYVATHSSITSSDLSSKQFPYSKNRIEFGNAKKDLSKLWRKELLDRYDKRKEGGVKQKRKTRMKYSYKLSKHGIYNLIANNEALPFEIGKSLLSNYSDHILFGFFLFPYIEQETLSKVMDSSIFSQIFSYLHDCCKKLKELFFNINYACNQKNGNITQHLFTWENVDREELDRESLRSFLISKFHWDWLDKAHIKKIEDQSRIEVSYGMNSILIRNDMKRKATLTFRGKKLYEFDVREYPNGHHAVSVVLRVRRGVVFENFPTFTYSEYAKVYSLSDI